MIQLDYAFPEDEEFLKKFEDVKLSTNLNMAIVNYKLNNFNDSIKHCNEVLSDYPDNLKALTRKAMSFMALCKLNEARSILMKILQLDENSEYAKKELERIKQIVTNK
uniref:peptidylprolyl isomerase n=1 Tax=Theileria parva TaxID=5875 RepID=Q4N6N2_THEPA|eukprot:XP_766659.1 hypothetical protein [Theileria parva strain Muguga]